MLPRLFESHVGVGQLELVFLDLPLRMHPQAFQAAEAVHCAGEQDMFWDMHHYLFAYQNALQQEDLRRYANELGLEVEAFAECLESGRHAKGIREDMEVARKLGVTGTPAFVLGRRVPESDEVEVLEVVKGLAPYEHFVELIDELVEPR